jgi:hypothetical protein
MSMSHAKNSLLALPVNTVSNRYSYPSHDRRVITDGPQTPADARRSLFMDNYDMAGEEDILPPNMRRGDSVQWSEADSEVLLVPSDGHPDQLSPPLEGDRYRGDRF